MFQGLRDLRIGWASFWPILLFQPFVSNAASSSSSTPPAEETKTSGTPTSEQLFEIVFKKKKPLPPSLKAGLLIEDEESPEVKIKLDPTPSLIQIEAAPLLEHLNKWITPGRVQRLRTQVREDMISLGSLHQIGIQGAFDEHDLKLKLNIPLKIRKMQIRNLSGRNETLDPPGLIHSKFLSGFLNTTSTENYQHGSLGGFAYDSSSLSSAFDGALNIGSVVLEGQATYDGLQTQPWRRGDVRLIKDIPSLILRVTAGDLIYPTFGFARTVPVGGVGVSTQFGTRPTLLVTSLGHHEIELKFPSTVNIYRNDQLVQTLKLREGRYDLQDIPLATGANNLKIEVIDSSGRSEVIHVSQFYDSGFLAPGLHQFTYNAGFLSTVDGAHRYYDSTHSVLMFSHRIGITSEFTLGAFFEHSEVQDVYGASFLIPAFGGILQTDLAASQTTSPSLGTGEAVRTRYSYITPVSKSFGGTRNFGLEIEAHSPQFSYFADTNGASSLVWDVFGSYSEPIGQLFNLNVGGGYTLGIDPLSKNQIPSYRVRTGMTKVFDRAITGNLNLTYYNAPGNVEFSGAAYITITFPEKKQMIRAAYDSTSDRSMLAWNYSPNTTVGATRGGVELDHDHTSRNLTGNIGYVANRGEILLQEDLRNNTSSIGGTLPSDTLTSQTRLSVATALVFAGTEVTLSRTVPDSFVIVKGHRTLRGQTLEIDPLGDGTYLAQNDFLGPAVLNNLGSYQKNEVHLGDAELSGSRGFIKNHYAVRPTYKSGAVISLDDENGVTVRGRFVQVNGTPIAHLSGEIIESGIDAKMARHIPFFTNKVGLFQIDGLKPGNYQILFFDDQWMGYTLNIPDKDEDTIDLGPLIIRVRPGKETKP